MTRRLNVRGIFTISGSALLFIFSAGNRALADVEINTLLKNASFELPSVGSTPGACPIDWRCDGSPGLGVYMPTSAQYVPNADGLSFAKVVPNGVQAAYAPTGLAGSGIGIQNLTTTSWLAGTDYTFTFWLGVPKTEPDGVTPVAGPPPALQLYFYKDGVQGQDGGQLPSYELAAPATGQWEQVVEKVSASQVFDAGAAGQKIGIAFFVSTSNGNNQLINFDISPVPEAGFPAQFLGGFLLAGTMALKRFAGRRA